MYDGRSEGVVHARNILQMPYVVPDAQFRRCKHITAGKGEPSPSAEHDMQGDVVGSSGRDTKGGELFFTHPNISAVHDSPTLLRRLSVQFVGQLCISLRISMVFLSQRGAILAKSFLWMITGIAIGSKKVQLWQYRFAICARGFATVRVVRYRVRGQISRSQISRGQISRGQISEELLASIAAPRV